MSKRTRNTVWEIDPELVWQLEAIGVLCLAVLVGVGVWAIDAIGR